MDEFLKVSSSEKKILEALRNLKPYEEVRIMADKDGKFDTFFYEQTTKIVIRFGQESPIKDIWKK